MPFGTTTMTASIVLTATTTILAAIICVTVCSAPLTVTTSAGLKPIVTTAVCALETRPTGARSATSARSAWRKSTAPPAPSATSARMTSCAANAIRAPAAPSPSATPAASAMTVQTMTVTRCTARCVTAASVRWTSAWTTMIPASSTASIATRPASSVRKPAGQGVLRGVRPVQGVLQGQLRCRRLPGRRDLRGKRRVGRAHLPGLRRLGHG